MTMHGITKDAKVCANCKHYYQHWAPYPEPGMGFIPIFAGNCAYPRNKNREPDQTCEYFTRRAEPLPEEEGRPLALLERIRREISQMNRDLKTVENWIDATHRKS